MGRSLWTALIALLACDLAHAQGPREGSARGMADDLNRCGSYKVVPISDATPHATWWLGSAVTTGDLMEAAKAQGYWPRTEPASKYFWRGSTRYCGEPTPDDMREFVARFAPQANDAIEQGDSWLDREDAPSPPTPLSIVIGEIYRITWQRWDVSSWWPIGD